MALGPRFLAVRSQVQLSLGSLGTSRPLPQGVGSPGGSPASLVRNDTTNSHHGANSDALGQRGLVRHALQEPGSGGQ